MCARTHYILTNTNEFTMTLFYYALHSLVAHCNIRLWGAKASVILYRAPLFNSTGVFQMCPLSFCVTVGLIVSVFYFSLSCTFPRSTIVWAKPLITSCN